ncbi:MAG: hypothetical protein K2W85_15735 [Phycisphaerales bacterium]|nr:hypothetical protein [Phycisphaerales bacterium]
MALTRASSRRHGSMVLVCVLVAIGGTSVSLAYADELAAKAVVAKTPSSGQKSAQSRIDAYIRVLGFDAEQGAAARDLHQSMTAELARQSKKTREAIAEAGEDRRAGDIASSERRMDEAIRASRQNSKKVTQQFLDDLKAILRPDQAASWQTLEQYRRRELHLRGGTVGGAGVDLFRIVDQLNLTGEPASKAALSLDEYALDIDRVLRDRERVAAEDEKAFEGVLHLDEKKMRERFDRDRAIDLRVREVNLKHLRRLASVLPEDLARKLDDQFQLKGYRQAYRKTALNHTLAKAKELPGLSPEQKQKVDALAARHASQSRAASDRLAAAIRAAEDAGKFAAEPMVMVDVGAGFLGDKDADDAVRDARLARREVDRAVRDELAGILTPEQLAAIPKPNPGSGVGQRIEVHSNGADEMVFISDMDEEDLPPPELGGGVMVRTVEVRTGQPTTAPDSEKSGEQPAKKD